MKKAATIPWNEIEEKYAALFPGKKGMPAKPLRTALGSLIIQKQYEYLDRELVEQQQYMYGNKVHSVKDRIVSISQPYIRPIHLMPTMNVMSSSVQLKDIMPAQGGIRKEF